MPRKKKVRNKYTMHRTQRSYLPKTDEAMARRDDALRRGRETRARNMALKREGKIPTQIKPAVNSKQFDSRLARTDIVTFATSPEFLGLHLYKAQEVLLRAQYGLPIQADYKETLMRLLACDQCPDDARPDWKTRDGFDKWLAQPKNEGVWVLGRRGTKSFLTSVCAIYEATRPHWRDHLGRNEAGYVIHMATREQQCRQIVGENCKRLLEGAGPRLAEMVEGIYNTTEIRLSNGIRIASFPTNSTAFRGLPCVCGILDECAFYYQDGVNADTEILRALRPAMAQFGDLAKLFLISSPGAKSGILWEYYRRPASPGRLVVQAPTTAMNPSVSDEWIDKERAIDPEGAAREYDAQFAERSESLFSTEMIDGAMVLDPATDREPVAGNRYVAGLDASGLTGRDRMGFGIAHIDELGRAVVDCMRSYDISVEFDLDAAEAAFDEMAALCRQYDCREVWIDQFAKGYIKLLLGKRGIEAEVRPSLAAVMLNLRSLMLRHKALLPISPELREGLESAQVYYSKTNQPSVGHPRSSRGHGDLADGVASAIWGTTQMPEVEVERVEEYDALAEFDDVCPGWDCGRREVGAYF